MSSGHPIPSRVTGGTHEAGCIYGGFSCGYWMIADGCQEDHWERHIVGLDETCPCGTRFPGARNCAVEFDSTEEER